MIPINIWVYSLLSSPPQILPIHNQLYTQNDGYIP